VPIFGVCRKPRRLLTSGVYRRLSLILQTFAITNALPFPARNDRRGHAEASGSLLPDDKAQLARDLDAVLDGPGDRAVGRVIDVYAFYGLAILLVGDEVKSGSLRYVDGKTTKICPLHRDCAALPPTGDTYPPRVVCHPLEAHRIYSSMSTARKCGSL
jgi:hypothetical protein